MKQWVVMVMRRGGEMRGEMDEERVCIYRQGFEGIGVGIIG